MPGLSPLLQGLLVLDMTQVLSGPYCTQVLGDLGAEVIKLEAPQGDLARAMQPHFVGPDSVYFVSLNRNKRSVVVDLKTPEGVELVRRLGGARGVGGGDNPPRGAGPGLG